MDSIVLELQQEAMRSNSDISDMLRKSLVIARKLKIKEFEAWVNSELSGYMNNLNNIPDYREIRGRIQFFNPYYGWRPVIIPDDKLYKIITTHSIAQSITEVEYLMKSDGDDLVIQLPQETQATLSDMGDRHSPTEFRVVFGKSQAQHIIDSVRKIILDWSIQLEEDGILGEGISFSDKEKQEANKHNYTVNNFYGNTTGVQIQQHTLHSTQTQVNGVDLEKVGSFISTLQQNISNIELDSATQKSVEKEIEEISKQLSSAKPKASAVKESMATIRNILEGLTGSLIASGLLHELSKISM